ncbi:MAG: hypothetical protein H6760_04970 [Candidatus Nomurabacteria bacterium]|nr:MAG: hypothetical protein H6760_04970 [Candidatus Nomurabacteria bacterium]
MYPKPINLELTESLLVAITAILRGVAFLCKLEVSALKLVNEDGSGSDRIRHINFEVKCVIDGKPVVMTGRVSVERGSEDDPTPWQPMLLDLDLAEGKGSVSCGFDFEAVCGKVLVIRCVPMESCQSRPRA